MQPDEPPAAAEPDASAASRPKCRANARPNVEAELVVAQRAIDLRKEGAPLDRVLRIQEIAWEESPERRERLAQVATRWFNYSGDFQPGGAAHRRHQRLRAATQSGIMKRCLPSARLGVVDSVELRQVRGGELVGGARS